KLFLNTDMRLSFIYEKITSTSKWRELIKYISKNFENKRISDIKVVKNFWSCLISCLYLHLKKTIVVVIPTWEKAMQITEDIKSYVNYNDVYLFPPRENLPHERLSPSKVTSGIRLKTLNLLQKLKPIIVLTSVGAVLDKIAPVKAGVHLPLAIKVGTKISFEGLIRNISNRDYVRENKTYFPGHFSVRGGVLDVFDVTSKYPYRIEFFGDTVESIREFSTVTQRSLHKLDKVNIYSSREIMIKSKQIDYENNFTYYEGIESDIAKYYEKPQNFFEYIPQESIILFCDQIEFNLRLKNLVNQVLDSFVFKDDAEKENYILNTIIDPDRYFNDIKKPIIRLDVISTKPDSFSYKVKNQRKVRGDRSRFFKNLESDSKKLIHSIICLGSITRVNRLIDIFDEEGVPYKFYKKKVPKSMSNTPIIIVSPLSSGFIDEESKISVYSQSDLFIKRIRHTPIYKQKEAVPIIRPSDLNPDNHVVHNIHGIGIYDGMV
ncbi:unnamed protein product, partial [marine sediment metagenome]